MAIRVSGMNSGMDTDAMVQDLVNVYKKKGEKNVKNKTKLEWKQTIWGDLNKKIKKFQSKVNNMKFSSSYNLKKTTSSDENKATVVASGNAVRGTQTLEVTQLAKTAYVTSGQLTATDGTKLTADSTLADLGVTSNGKIKVNNVEFDVNTDTKISDVVQNLKDAGLDASFDEGNGRFFISAKESGASNNFSFEAVGADNGAIAALKLTSDSGASVIEGQNAKVLLNGAEFESDTNSFSINGLAINVKGLTDKGSPITLTTDTDTDAIYNSIKGLVKEYSELIKELDKLYNAGAASKYEPLTDEEKEAMSDSEIEKWETKIKDSLLRRDGNVSSVANAMKTTMLGSYSIGGKSYTLSDFGINTMGYFDSGENEKNVLHIAGDEDDDSVSGQTNKLKNMIIADPDAVTDFFTKLMTDMSDKLSSLSKSTSNRSYGNFFDDKRVTSDLKNWESKIAKWDDYVADIEDKYYKQFSRMESQLAKLNSTQTSLAGYFGG